MDKPIALTLAKLLVAVAWADGELQDEEVQILKDLVYKIPDLSRDDWASVEVYMDEPITANECVQLMAKFKSLIKTDADKEYAVQALKDVVYADGHVDESERKLYELIVSEIQEASVGFDKRLEELFRGARNKRRDALNKIPRRERNIDEFLENPIFFRSFRKLTDSGINVQMDKSELEKLCVAGALLACVAQADGEIHPNEVVLIRRLLKKYWHISDAAARIVSEIAVNHEVAGMDILRMCRKFFSETDSESRMDFFRALVALVKSDYEVHPNERERLRSIAINLKISQDVVMELVPKVGALDESEVEDFLTEEEDREMRARDLMENKKRSLEEIAEDDYYTAQETTQSKPKPTPKSQPIAEPNTTPTPPPKPQPKPSQVKKISFMDI